MFSFALLIYPALWPQTGFPLPDAMPQSSADPASYIGLTLQELIGSFGIPGSVYAVRGLEEWQDDVVFAYNGTDFYIYRDRVWQVALMEAYFIRTGDMGSAIPLSFGEALYSDENCAIFPLKGQNWPMALRVNFDSAGKVAMIFIYRSDL